VYKPALDTQQAFDCRATAALLRSLMPLAWVSHGVALAALWQPEYRLSLIAWPAVLYFAVRIHLDAGLFELLAQDPATGPARLDDWLARMGLRRPGAARSMDERCAGARRLARWFLLAWGTQMLVMVVSVIRRTV
jgi:hypothetical protein